MLEVMIYINMNQYLNQGPFLTVIFSSWAVKASSKSSCFWRRVSTAPREFPRSSFSRKAYRRQKDTPALYLIGGKHASGISLRQGPRKEVRELESKVGINTKS